jgi:hypothetical protein
MEAIMILLLAFVAGCTVTATFLLVAVLSEVRALQRMIERRDFTFRQKAKPVEPRDTSWKKYVGAVDGLPLPSDTAATVKQPVVSAGPPAAETLNLLGKKNKSNPVGE